MKIQGFSKQIHRYCPRHSHATYRILEDSSTLFFIAPFEPFSTVPEIFCRVPVPPISGKNDNVRHLYDIFRDSHTSRSFRFNDPVIHSVTEEVKSKCSFFCHMLSRDHPTECAEDDALVMIQYNDHSASFTLFDAENSGITRHDRRATQQERAFEEIKAIAARETNLICRWKISLVILLALAATLVGTGTFVILTLDEDENYHQAVSVRKPIVASTATINSPLSCYSSLLLPF
jgi:hypothetical protein